MVSNPGIKLILDDMNEMDFNLTESETIEFGEIANNSDVWISIPFTADPDQNDVDVFSSTVNG